MLTVLGYAVVVFAVFWLVKDPAGAAGTVAYVAHQLGVAATSLEQHLGKPGLTGGSPR
jgi:hypothetical protein